MQEHDASVPLPETLVGARGRPPERALPARGRSTAADRRPERGGRAPRASAARLPEEVLGHLGLDARADHRALRRARQVHRPGRGQRAARAQRRARLRAGAPGGGRRRDAAPASAGRGAGAARRGVARHPGAGAGSRRYRPAADGRYRPGRREAARRGAEPRPVGPDRGIAGGRARARRRARLRLHRPPGGRRRRRHPDRRADPLRAHDGTGAAGAPAAAHRGGGRQDRPLALPDRRRAARGGAGGVPDPQRAAARSAPAAAGAADERGPGRPAGDVHGRHGRRGRGTGEARRARHAPERDGGRRHDGRALRRQDRHDHDEQPRRHRRDPAGCRDRGRRAPRRGAGVPRGEPGSDRPRVSRRGAGSGVSSAPPPRRRRSPSSRSTRRPAGRRPWSNRTGSGSGS